MKYALLDDDCVITQIDCNERDDFVEVPDTAVPGMTYIDDTLATVEKTTAEQFTADYKELTATYNTELTALSLEFANAHMWNSDAEDDKETEIRAELTALKTQYLADIETLKTTYGY